MLRQGFSDTLDPVAAIAAASREETFVMRARVIRRAVMGAAAAGALVVATAGAGLAHECTNLDKKPGAGAQLVFGPTGDVVYISKGLQNRVDRGIVDFETGEGFSGLIGFDDDGDGVADGFTWIVGPNGEIPQQAQWNGSMCHGVINFAVVEDCLAG